MLYGRPQKYVRHVDHDEFTIEPQRFYVHTFWKYYEGASARSDGQDLQDTKTCPLGSKISNHRLELLIQPETIEPQQVYMGTIALSFNDLYHPSICGLRNGQASYQDTSTDANYAVSNAITPHFYANKTSASTGDTVVSGDETSNQEIGGSSSGYGIAEWKLDDQIKHWIRAKKVTVFDQRPLVSDRKQPIPSKVKRINDGTYYGLWFFNDADRGATPADTQISVDIKSTWTEMAI